LKFPEIRRGVQALSSQYVEKRNKLESGAALAGAGKRAAFALFFGPLHFLLVREIVRALGAEAGPSIIDIGCGTGVAGSAWALAASPPSKVRGVERNPWAASECRWTYQTLGIQGTVRNADISTLKLPRDVAVIAAFIMNELDVSTRQRYLRQFLASERRAPALVIEPVARRLVAWWDEWARQWTACGGREDTWRFRIELPERLRLMDRAAGLDHSELTGRSLWLPGQS
jgi:hypothetical protein